MTIKKKNANTQPATITQGEALASLLKDRVTISDNITQALRQIDALQQVVNDAEEAHEIAIGKIAMFMRERGLTNVRCDGLLVSDLGDRLDIKPDHYTDLSA